MNIYDIAKLSKVSIATVSRVINGSDRVSEKTKKKVEDVMAAYGYKPNVFARSLNLEQSMVVGIMCPNIADRYMAKGVSFLEKQLRSYGYDCILMCSGYDFESKVECVKSLIDRRIDALFLVGSNYAKDHGNKDIEYLKDAALKMPIILINGYLNYENIYCVLTDNKKAVYKATDMLIKQGRKNIIFLFDSYSYSLKKKMQGFELALKDNGILIDKNNLIFVPNSIMDTYKILEERNIEFDGVIASDDAMAIGALKLAYSRGIEDKVSVVGYNNSELCLCSVKELSSIDSKIEDLCDLAVKTLLKVINNEKVSKKQVIDCEFIERGSTKL